MSALDVLSPLDAAFLRMEDAHSALHLASVGIFDGPPPRVGELVARLAPKLHLVPRTRQVVREVPLWLGRPVWVDAAAFRIGEHVFSASLPPDSDRAALDAFVGAVMSRRMDRGRPLWEMWIVDGLTESRWALITKAHHCMLDGIAGVDMLSTLLDHRADADALPLPDWQPEPAPGTARLLAGAVTSLSGRLAASGRAALGAAARPRDALRSARTDAGGLRELGHLVRPAPASSLLGRLGSDRTWTSARVPVAEIAAIRHAFGGTLNDVVLAAITDGYRRMLLARGEQPGNHSVRTLVPVSVRATGAAHGSAPDSPQTGNEVSAVVAELPVGVADPVERLQAVRAELDRLKHSGEAPAAHLLTDLAYWAPPLLFNAVTTLAFQIPQRAIVTVTTNVPGPRGALYAAGRRLRELYPCVPIAYRLRVGVAITSYDDTIYFGVTADRESTPDAAVLTAGIEHGVAELVAAAIAASGSTSPGSTSPGSTSPGSTATA